MQILELVAAIGLGAALCHLWRCRHPWGGASERDRLNLEIQAADEKSLASLEMGRLLGSGSFGRCFRARWLGVNIAVKVIDHEPGSHSDSECIQREAMIGVATSHPNVVTCYRVMTQSHGDSQQTLILMELCDRDTLDKQAPRMWALQRSSPAHGTLHVIRCLIDIAAGLRFMHSVGVVHGDIKCQNVLCKSTRSDSRGFMCKIADFGLSRCLDARRKEVPAVEPGSVLYAAPECLMTGKIRLHSDVYGFGMIAWHLVTPDSFETTMRDAQLWFSKCERNWAPSLSGSIPEVIKALIVSCWQECDSRPSFLEIQATLEHLHATFTAQAERSGSLRRRSSSDSGITHIQQCA
jgi:serine/threonine protein kinase